MTTTGRKGRFFRRAEADPEDRDADLSGDEHAWWAARETVTGVPRDPGAVTHQGQPQTGEKHFSDHRTAGPPVDEQPPPAPPEGDTGEADFDVPGSMDLHAAHLVLQIEIGAEWETITRAHRKLAKQFHPDRLVEHSPEAQELGRSRMAEINAAHATLRALHFH